MEDILETRAVADEDGPKLEIVVNRFPPMWTARMIILLTIVVAEAFFLLLAFLFRGPSANNPSTKSAKTSPMAGDFSSQGLSIDCKTEIDLTSFSLKITVAGEIKGSERLALVLNYPSGRTEDLAILGRKSMEENYNDFTKKVEFSYDFVDLKTFQAGIYALTLRSFAQKKDVCRKGIDLSLKKIAIKDVTVSFTNKPSNKFVDSIALSLEKEGIIPVALERGHVEIKGGLPIFKKRPAPVSAKHETFFIATLPPSLEKMAYITERSHSLSLRIDYPLSLSGEFFPQFSKGSKCQINGEIFYFEDGTKKPLRFAKEVTVD